MATEKVSLSLDEELVAEAREAVGPRGLSGYVNRALHHQLQHDRIAGLLEELEKAHGAIDPQTLDEVRRAWPAAEDGTTQRRSA
jgi:Arc/MetJ family transcription regulator